MRLLLFFFFFREKNNTYYERKKYMFIHRRTRWTNEVEYILASDCGHRAINAGERDRLVV